MAFWKRKRDKSTSWPFYWSSSSRASWVSQDQQQCIANYRAVYSLQRAISLISESVADIPLLVLDTSGDKPVPVPNHPSLALMANPNTNSTYSEFVREAMSYFLITGNDYLIAGGSVTRPPVSLINAMPQTVSISPSSFDGYADQYQLSFNGTYSDTFTRASDVDFRFYDDPDPDFAGRELYQIKRFNPCNVLYGESLQTGLFFQLRQLIESDTHNLGLLANGMRPGYLINVKGLATSDQISRLQSQLSDTFNGGANAGRNIVTGGTDIEIKDLGLTSKDMDYSTLYDKNTIAVYNVYGVPLPLVSPDTMTLANLASAQTWFYINTVIPYAMSFFQDLTRFLMPRYPRSENLVFGFNPKHIPALASKEIAELSELSALDILTLNEQRSIAGFAPIAGGDTIYKPVNEVPVTQKAQARKALATKLISAVDESGKRIYTDRQVKSLVDDLD